MLRQAESFKVNILRQQISTIIGILVLISGIAAGVYLVQKGGVWSLKADPGTVPKEIKITNISENNFTVSWITEKETIGFIKYGMTPSLETTVGDERDKLSGKPAPYFIHHVKIENLKPETKYYFNISSEKRLYDNQGKPYEITTGPALGTPPLVDTTYGTILKVDGSPAEGVVVYLNLANSTPLSALAKSGGNWMIPLSVTRAANLSSYITYDPDASVEEIFVQGGSLGTAMAIVTTKNDSPVPTITLGGSYDFRETEIKGRTQATPTPSTTRFSLQSLITPPAAGGEELSIIDPGENEEVVTQKPEIRGTGPEGTTLNLTLESPENFITTVTINKDGSWSWIPPFNLSPGEHRVTASLPDGTTISRRFTVLAAEGDLAAFSASPSGTLTPSPTPTKSLTPTPATSLTTTPTVTPIATLTATPTITPTVVPRKAMPATEEGVPKSGYLTPTLFFVILGLSLVFTGLFLNFKLSF